MIADTDLVTGYSSHNLTHQDYELVVGLKDRAMVIKLVQPYGFLVKDMQQSKYLVEPQIDHNLTASTWKDNNN